MIKECVEAGIPKPVYYYNMSGFFVEFSRDIYNLEYLSKIGLNERQIDSLIHFKSIGEIINSEYMKRYKITDRTARRDITELVEKEILIKEGEKKSSKYLYRNRNVR